MLSGWTIAKYACALAGIALALLADRVRLPWLGYGGIGLIVVGFLLRFPQRRAQREVEPPAL